MPKSGCGVQLVGLHQDDVWGGGVGAAADDVGVFTGGAPTHKFLVEMIKFGVIFTLNPHTFYIYTSSYI
jgi:hypothetical protein